jgi:hypothetical protein
MAIRPWLASENGSQRLVRRIRTSSSGHPQSESRAGAQGVIGVGFAEGLGRERQALSRAESGSLHAARRRAVRMWAPGAQSESSSRAHSATPGGDHWR